MNSPGCAQRLPVLQRDFPQKLLLMTLQNDKKWGTGAVSGTYLPELLCTLVVARMQMWGHRQVKTKN